MKLETLVNYLYLANCAAQRIYKNDQDTKLPKLSFRHRAGEIIGSHVATPDLDEDHTRKSTLGLEPVIKEARVFNDYFKECLMQLQVIDILFSKDEVLCEGFRKLTKEAQLDLVDRSKNHVLAQFHLPSLKEILGMIRLPNKQFNSTLFLKLKEAGVDPRNASKHGKQFVQKCLIKSGTGVIESILHHYWSSAPFRNEFVERLFKALASTLTIREYLEFESLLSWIHSEYHLIDKDDYNKLNVIIKRNYPLPLDSLQYLQIWRSVRPLEGGDKPVSKPTHH